LFTFWPPFPNPFTNFSSNSDSHKITCFICLQYFTERSQKDDLVFWNIPWKYGNFVRVKIRVKIPDICQFCHNFWRKDWITV
jgi:hypothetical protein